MSRLVARVLWVGLISSVAHAAERPWTLSSLLQTLQHTTSHRVRFTETNHIAGLKRPLHLRCALRYTPPNTLVMKQSVPHKAVYRIVGDRLYVNHATRGVAVSRYPGLIAIVSGFEGLLSGNQALLTHDFAVTLSGDVGAWRLVLHPRLAELRRAVTTVAITGRGGQLVEITTLAPRGDFSVMHILP